MARTSVSKAAAIALVVFARCETAASQPSPSWTSRDRIALTYYFYWYDAHSNYHFINRDGSDGLTDHPTDAYRGDYSWAEIAWHQRELADISAAKIDAVLPVYWGDQVNSAAWSQAGIRTLVAAERAMLQAGTPAPKIGMFYDTTAWLITPGTRPDLTTADGKAIFYSFIKDYFSLVPRELWATIDGKPIVVLYYASYASTYNQSTFDYVTQQMKSDFGVAPYLIRETSWKGVASDAAYVWGAAVLGPGLVGDVGMVGPGYDDSAVSDRATHLYQDRQCGSFYQRAWDRITQTGSRLVLIETWNELHEATDIAYSREYGRQYIDLTARNVQRWRSAPVSGFADAPFVWVNPGRDSFESGLIAPKAGDGAWKTARIAGRDATYADRTTTPPSYYIYLVVDDGFISATPSQVWVSVEYLDVGTSPWWVDYDGVNGPYTASAVVTPTNTGVWMIHTFRLPDAYFGNRQNLGADLRIADHPGAAGNAADYFGRVWISKSSPSGIRPPSMTPLDDVSLGPGDVLDIPLSASDPSGGPIAISLAGAPGFASLHDTGGARFLRLAPAAADLQKCSYPLTILASDNAKPSLSDSASLRVTVRSEPTLSLNPANLTYLAFAGSAQALTQKLTLSNASGAAFNWTASAGTQSGGDWLRVPATSGTGQAALQVAANPAGLAPGTYQGSITVNAPGLAQATRTVAVTLTIVGRPVIATGAPALSFAAPGGQDAQPQSFTISNNGAAGFFSWVAIPSTATGGNWLSVSPGSAAGNAALQVTAHSAALVDGIYRGTIAISSPQAQNSPTTVPVTLTVGSLPSIGTGGVVNNASYAAGGLAPSAIAAVFGNNLTDGTSCLPPACVAVFQGGRLSTTMAGVQVSVNGIAAPIFYATPGQLGIQIPNEVNGSSASVQVSVRGQGSAPQTMPIATAAPGIFSVSSDGAGAGIVTHADAAGTLVSAQNPALPGETVILYATGLGRVSPPVATGALPSGASSVASPMTVTIDGVQVTPDFAGLSGCCVGLNQINVRMPAQTRVGAVPVTISVGGKVSNTLTLVVGSP